MNRKAGDTRKARSGNRGVLGLVAVICLNLAIQPCAIAMAGNADCAHCPPAAERAPAVHHGRHAAADRAAAPCATLEKPCSGVDGVGLDQRGSQSKAKFPGDAPDVIAHDVPVIEPARADRTVLPTGPPADVAVTPPLNLLYCVFLK